MPAADIPLSAYEAMAFATTVIQQHEDAGGTCAELVHALAGLVAVLAPDKAGTVLEAWAAGTAKVREDRRQ